MGETIYDATKQSDQKVAETSKNAYKKLDENGQDSQTEQVRKALKAMGGEATISELSKEALAGWEKSTISGRLNDLKEKGVVQDLPNQKREDKYTGIKSKPWRLMVRDV